MAERVLESAISVRPFFVPWEWIGPPPLPIRFSQKNLFSGTRQIEDLAIDHPSGRRSAHGLDIDRQRGYISGGDTQTVLPGYLDMADFQGHILLMDFHKMRTGGDSRRRGVKLKIVDLAVQRDGSPFEKIKDRRPVDAVVPVPVRAVRIFVVRKIGMKPTQPGPHFLREISGYDVVFFTVQDIHA